MTVLSHAEIASHLSTRPDWRIEGGELVRTFKFETFRDAVTFVNQVADIRYNRVRLALVSHDAGGLTSNDFAVAAGADHLI
jgi:4a-hydroxytetrahydrobiopterin dehydratase